jgi:hypothetical protein
VIQLTRSGPVISPAARHLDRLRTQFDGEHCIRLPAFIDAELLRFIQKHFEHARFDIYVHKNIGVELSLAENVALSLLLFLSNDPKLFDVIRQITGCDRIGCFVGRVYRMAPGAGHYDSWHDDTLEHRLIGMSVNLGAHSYDGGIFRLREASSKKLLCEAVNTGPGDAIVFRIARHLEHCVTTVEGTEPKTAFAGWFKSEPEFLSLLTRTETAREESLHTGGSGSVE